jgi:hypothetical protein
VVGRNRTGSLFESIGYTVYLFVEQGEIVFLMSPSAVVNNWHA